MTPLSELNDGRSIPQLGLGTWLPKGDSARHAMAAAIGLGYRHIGSNAEGH